VTAGYPSRDVFAEILVSAATTADVVEVGVPFTDPMADGLTIQEASRVALDDGVTLDWILRLIGDLIQDLAAPVLLMGYYNPFLAYGFDRLGVALAQAGVSGVIVPDLPLEEAGPLSEVLSVGDLALVHLVTPTTSPGRLRQISDASSGFLYAVTMTGVTGGSVRLADSDVAYLEAVRAVSSIPVMAGFGIRTKEDVAALAPHVDGVIVGSALVDAIRKGEDPASFIDGLRVTGVTA
jgi:tryptophan synthase alpha chain